MSLMEKEQQLSQLQEQLEQHQDDVARRMQLAHEIKELQEEMYQDLSAWDRVYLARHPRRPKAQDYLKRLFHMAMTAPSSAGSPCLSRRRSRSSLRPRGAICRKT